MTDEALLQLNFVTKQIIFDFENDHEMNIIDNYNEILNFQSFDTHKSG